MISVKNSGALVQGAPQSEDDMAPKTIWARILRGILVRDPHTGIVTGRADGEIVEMLGLEFYECKGVHQVVEATPEEIEKAKNPPKAHAKKAAE